MRYSKERLDELQRLLYSAVIADILDEIGVKDFVMDSKMKPIINSGAVVGYARTLYAVDVFKIPESPYQLDLEFIDSLNEGDLFIATVNGNNYNGFFGELLATATVAHGGRGAIIDGYVRDVEKINEMGFPLYCIGTDPRDSKGRVDAILCDEPIVCAGAKVRPGDMIFADIDGIVVIPKEHIAEVIDKALDKVSGENVVREELRAGVSVKAVFNKYGIL